MKNKTKIKTTTFSSPRTKSSVSLVPALDWLLERYILVCWWVSFRECAVSSGRTITPTSCSMTCSGDAIETEVAKSSQAFIPSAHVWSNCVSPASPHFLNQAPPRAQQLCFPNLFTIPHLGHSLLPFTADELVLTGVSARMQAWI